jgi:hypothetical protein
VPGEQRSGRCAAGAGERSAASRVWESLAGRSRGSSQSSPYLRYTLSMSSIRPLPSIPPEAWPAPDTLLSRSDLCRLFGVSREVVRAWDRRKIGPPLSQKGVFKDQKHRAAYIAGEVRAWYERQKATPVETLIAAVNFDLSAPAQPSPAATELVEPPPAPVEYSVRGFEWCALDDGDEPFTCNNRRSRPARSGGYWG